MAVYTTIDDSSLFMNTVLYAGNSPSTQSITGVGFQPDLIWVKSRDSTEWHNIVDAVRGNTSNIYSNATNAADIASRVTAFGADGFSLGAIDTVNELGSGLVAWNWKAGTTSGISGGTITPSGYSFNTTSGFSIIVYTGTGVSDTIPHGLGVVPQAVMVKKLNATDGWFSYHEPLGNLGRMMLDNTNAAAYDAGYWDAISPTSSVFSVRGNGGNNATGDTYVAYCFADVSGYSKFGSYTGNGDGGSTLASGPFVYTGFRPAWLLAKRTNSTGNWMLIDNKRIGYNADNRDFKVDSDDAERDVDQADLLSNGFRVRTTSSDWNTDGGNYIYLAFAESPFVNSSGVPNNAR